jgi:hypothetical protein
VAVTRINASKDVVNGLAVVSDGDRGTQPTYDNVQRTVHIPDPSGVTLFVELAGRYIHHGGPGGSGQW